VVFVEPSREVLRGRPDLDQVVRVPRPSERNRGLTEQRFDVHRLVRHARSALLLLLDEPDNGGVALGKRPLVGDARRSCRRDAKRGEGEKRHEPETSRCAQKSVPLMRRVWMRTDPIPSRQAPCWEAPAGRGSVRLRRPTHRAIVLRRQASGAHPERGKSDASCVGLSSVWTPVWPPSSAVALGRAGARARAGSRAPPRSAERGSRRPSLGRARVGAGASVSLPV
jgi:hypothetical protein